MRKVALVTGGSRGIGASCVRALAQNGMSVVFLCKSAVDKAQALSDGLRKEGLDVSWYVCDVANAEQVRQTMAEITRVYHHVDVLVNNAAVSRIVCLPTPPRKHGATCLR